MAFTTAFFIVAIAIILIWIVIETKRLKHKIVAILLIGLLIFGYITLTTSFKDKEIDIKTIPGIIKAGKIYWSWLGTLFTNTKSITAYASQQDWKKIDEEKIETPTKLEEKIEDVNEIWDKL